MATVDKDLIIDGLVTKLVALTHNIEEGDLFTHKTDVNLSELYVVTGIHMDIDKEEIYIVGSSHTNAVHHDGVAFKLMEIQKVGPTNEQE